MQRDPKEYVDGLNLYTSRSGYPLDVYDPSGEDWLDYFNDCLADNEPAGLALEAAIAALAVHPIPKTLVANLYEAFGDKRTARHIRASLKKPGISRTTNLPSSLKQLMMKNNAKSSIRKVGKVATRIAGPVLVGYGLALATVEVHCGGFCCGVCVWGNCRYDPNEGNIIETLRKTYFE